MNLSQKVTVTKPHPSNLQMLHSDLPDGAFFEDDQGNLCVKTRHDYRTAHNNTFIINKDGTTATHIDPSKLCYPVSFIHINYSF